MPSQYIDLPPHAAPWLCTAVSPPTMANDQSISRPKMSMRSTHLFSHFTAFVTYPCRKAKRKWKESINLFQITNFTSLRLAVPRWDGALKFPRTPPPPKKKFKSFFFYLFLFRISHKNSQSAFLKHSTRVPCSLSICLSFYLPRYLFLT